MVPAGVLLPPIVREYFLVDASLLYGYSATTSAGMPYEAFDCMPFPCPCSRLKIWSRETGSAVPSRISLLISIPRLNLVLTNLRDSSRVSRRRPFIYYERSEFVKAWLREKIVRKKPFVVSHRGAFTGNHILEDYYCTYSPSHLFWRQRSFRRAIACTVRGAAVGSA